MNNDVPFGAVLFGTILAVDGLLFLARDCSTYEGKCPSGMVKVLTRYDGWICAERPR